MLNKQTDEKSCHCEALAEAIQIVMLRLCRNISLKRFFAYAQNDGLKGKRKNFFYLSWLKS